MCVALCLARAVLTLLDLWHRRQRRVVDSTGVLFMDLYVFSVLCLLRVCLFVPCGHLLGRADLLALVRGV